ncbi:MAG: MmcB family DNA repair protein [Alphaproteobacteria bacterium]|nr:MmcB family DNA repair protein [Alphaproteobacteria bacterium]
MARPAATPPGESLPCSTVPPTSSVQASSSDREMTGNSALALPKTPSPAALTAALLARGVCRALDQLAYASLLEFPLANGRRADILALGRGGDLVIVEIKTSVADFLADRKWAEYRDFADRFYFAVPDSFPAALIPEECGLIVADAFTASLIRDGMAKPLPPPRRRVVTLRFALAAAGRLRRHLDPHGAL